MPVIKFTTNLLPLSQLVSGALEQRERAFKDEVRSALTDSGVGIREVYALGSGFRFAPLPLADGTSEDVQWFTLDLGVDVDPIDQSVLEYICDNLTLPSFPQSAWKPDEN